MATKSFMSTILTNASYKNNVPIHDHLKSDLLFNELKPYSVFPTPSFSSSSVRHASSSQIVSSLGGRPGSLKPAGGDSSYLPFLKPTQLAPADSTSLEEMLDILRDRRGVWHQYAPLIPVLNRAGITTPVIEEATGMTGTEQNTAVVASQVYASISSSGKFTEQELSYFDAGGADILYELRVLSTLQREEASAYVIENQLDGKKSREIARAMKDHERRKREEGRNSFSTSPGDCLAFTLYRQSKEEKNESDKETVLKQALKYAVTEKAIAKINQALGNQIDEDIAEESKPVIEARILLARLTAEEASVRPIRVLGYLADLDQTSLENLEFSPNLEGSFSVFTPVSDSKWVFLPTWNAIKSVNSLVAITVKSVTELPEGLFSKSGDVPLLLADLADKTYDETFFYLTPSSSGLTLKSGGEVVKSGVEVCGKILLAVLPPIPEEDEKEWA